MDVHAGPEQQLPGHGCHGVLGDEQAPAGYPAQQVQVHGPPQGEQTGLSVKPGIARFFT